MLESLKRVRRGRLFVVVLATSWLIWLVLDYSEIKYHARDFFGNVYGFSQSAADINYATSVLGYWQNDDGWWRGNCTVTPDEDCRIKHPWPHGKGQRTVQTFLYGLGSAMVREHGAALLWRLLVGPLLIASSIVYLAPAIALLFWRWLAPR